MPEILLARARVRDLLASANWGKGGRRPWLDATPLETSPDNVHPIDRGNSRGVLLAEIKPVVDEELMAG